MSSSVEIPSSNIKNLLDIEIASYRNRTAKSGDIFQLASKSVPLGVASCYQCFDPYPFYVGDSFGACIKGII